jgi:hypothetical protein
MRTGALHTPALVGQRANHAGAGRCGGRVRLRDRRARELFDRTVETIETGRLAISIFVPRVELGQTQKSSKTKIASVVLCYVILV